jgi:hypothetical protein
MVTVSLADHYKTEDEDGQRQTEQERSQKIVGLCTSLKIDSLDLGYDSMSGPVEQGKLGHHD